MNKTSPGTGNVHDNHVNLQLIIVIISLIMSWETHYFVLMCVHNTYVFPLYTKFGMSWKFSKLTIHSELYEKIFYVRAGKLECQLNSG